MGEILKLLLWLLSAPQIAVSLLLEIFASQRLRADLAKCVAVAKRYGESVPSGFLSALRVAEDHRNEMHPGIDAIAMWRAVWVWVTSGRVQGASTIEQQFVRVVSGRYERTLVRKLREQALAVMLRRRVCGRAIGSAYLSIAYYGAASVGLPALNARFGNSLENVPYRYALRMVAQLKYPRPPSPCATWQANVEARFRVLLKRSHGTANISMQRRGAIKCTRPTLISR